MNDLHLEDGSRIAVIGGGPAGSMFSYFLLDMAERLGLELQVDIYEPRNFELPGPRGCNMCGGIISETLVQNLAAEGIDLPPTVVQRGIDSYMFHMDIGSVKIQTPLFEMRIGSVYRGAGPRDVIHPKWKSFDQHLLSLALARGATRLASRVENVSFDEAGKPRLNGSDGAVRDYDLVVAASGVNTGILKLFETMGRGYERPKTTKALIREYHLGEEEINRFLGSSMHVFLIRVPRLEYAAIIPKGDYVNMVLLGQDIDGAVADAFVASPEVRAVMPPNWEPGKPACQCLPHINILGVKKPYADRLVFIGDCGVTRLYKDGLGAAYRTAKAAARVAVFQGISERAFQRHYLRVCHLIATDNRVGRMTFMATRVIQRERPLRHAVLNMVCSEQAHSSGKRRMSSILWDLFSGSAPYLDIFKRMIHPVFGGRFLWLLVTSPRKVKKL